MPATARTTNSSPGRTGCGGSPMSPGASYRQPRRPPPPAPMARGEATPTVQEMPRFKNLVRLMAMTYDRGGKIVGMIEDRLGEDGFFDFMRLVYAKYQYRILRVADFQRELEAYTGRS